MDQVSRIFTVVLIMILIPVIWFMGVRGYTWQEFWAWVEGVMRRGKGAEGG